MEQRFLHLCLTTLGGAGIAARRLHEALHGQGHASAMIVGTAAPGTPDVHVIQSRRTRLKVFASKVHCRIASHRRFDFMNEAFRNPDEEEIASIAAEFRPTTLIVSQLAYFLPFRAVAAIARRCGASVIWFPMDMAHLTGGCHYSWECSRYVDACGHCPALRFGAGANDVTAQTLAGKRENLRGIRSGVVIASSQLLHQVKASALLADAPAKVIPLSVDPQRFRPRDKEALRSRWGLPRSGRVLFFGARHMAHARKGMQVLEEALRRLPALLGGEPPALLVAGDAPQFRALDQLGFTVVEAGMLEPDSLAEAYAAADLFVSPSLEDSGPMMVNEAVMSGLPVVAFPIGVAPDLVEDRITGRIADATDSAALANALAEIIAWDDSRLAKAAQRARQLALARLAPEAAADSFVAFAASVGK